MDVPREETLPRLIHPEYRNGSRVWTDGSAERVMDLVRFGDRLRGWEGDPRLALYAVQHPAGIVWELCRLEHDGEYRLVARSSPGIPFDERIIDYLIAHDRRRGYDVHQAVVVNNERVAAAHDQADREFTVEEFAPRMRHALAEDIG